MVKRRVIRQNGHAGSIVSLHGRFISLYRNYAHHHGNQHNRQGNQPQPHETVLLMVPEIDPNATWDIVEQAKAQGVATATIAQQQDNVNLIYGMKEYDYGHTIGTQAGQWIKDNLGGKAKVAIISQDNVESVIARGDGVEDALKEICPDVEIDPGITGMR